MARLNVVEPATHASSTTRKKKKKNKKGPRLAGGERPYGGGTPASEPMIVEAIAFLGDGSLEDWQDLCYRVGLDDDTELTSKTKCKKVSRRCLL